MVINVVAKLATSPSFGTLAFRNGLEYDNSNERINGADSPSALFTNLVNFGPLTPEITTLEIKGLFLLAHPVY